VLVDSAPVLLSGADNKVGKTAETIASRGKVFISNAQEDEPLAKKIAAALKANGFDTWLGSEVSPGENWDEKINQVLREAKAMVVLLTPEALQSPSVQYEIEYALSHKSYKKRLIPVIVNEKKISSLEAPWILLNLPFIELGEGHEEEIGKIVEALKDAAQTEIPLLK